MDLYHLHNKNLTLVLAFKSICLCFAVLTLFPSSQTLLSNEPSTKHASCFFFFLNLCGFADAIFSASTLPLDLYLFKS